MHVPTVAQATVTVYSSKPHHHCQRQRRRLAGLTSVSLGMTQTRAQANCYGRGVTGQPGRLYISRPQHTHKQCMLYVEGCCSLSQWMLGHLGAVWPPQGGLLLISQSSRALTGAASQQQLQLLDRPARSAAAAWQQLPAQLLYACRTQCSSDAQHTVQRSALSGQQQSRQTHALTPQPPTTPIKTPVTHSSRPVTPHSPNPPHNQTRGHCSRSCNAVAQQKERKEALCKSAQCVLLAAQACQQESGAPWLTITTTTTPTTTTINPQADSTTTGRPVSPARSLTGSSSLHQQKPSSWRRHQINCETPWRLRQAAGHSVLHAPTAH